MSQSGSVLFKSSSCRNGQSPIQLLGTAAGHEEGQGLPLTGEWLAQSAPGKSLHSSLPRTGMGGQSWGRGPEGGGKEVSPCALSQTMLVSSTSEGQKEFRMEAHPTLCCSGPELLGLGFVNHYSGTV